MVILEKKAGAEAVGTGKPWLEICFIRRVISFSLCHQVSYSHFHL